MIGYLRGAAMVAAVTTGGFIGGVVVTYAVCYAGHLIVS